MENIKILKINYWSIRERGQFKIEGSSDLKTDPFFWNLGPKLAILKIKLTRSIWDHNPNSPFIFNHFWRFILFHRFRALWVFSKISDHKKCIFQVCILKIIKKLKIIRFFVQLVIVVVKMWWGGMEKIIYEWYFGPKKRCSSV